MLVVRTVASASGSSQVRPEDLTARARIRDAAIECFARDGFDASVRTLADRAGVSAGLITHHFGSKAKLRAECDTEVLRRYRLVKQDAVERPTPHLLEALADPGPDAALLVYILRAVHAGGPAARAFLTHLMDDARDAMADGVARGLVRPSRDEEARLRYLTYQTVGAMLVDFMLDGGSDPGVFVARMRQRSSDLLLPMLEVGTEGYLASREYLDSYLENVWEGRHGTDGGARTHAPPSSADPEPTSA
ncbi:TetR family transcriptional regulator [Beutenbergia cavernae]